MNRRRVTALAVRSHARDGTGRSAPGALEELRASAAALEDERTAALASAPEVGADGVMTVTLASPPEALPVVLAVADALRPAKTTFGLAIVPGADPSDDPREGPRVAEGLAAARARECLDQADPRAARVVVAARERRQAVSTLLDLVLEAYDTMTPRQRQIVELAKHSPTQQDVATHLNISRQAVNQSLTAAGWFHLRSAEEVIHRRLADLGGQAVPSTSLPLERQ